MHPQDCFHLCHKYYGRMVHIEDQSGGHHIGRIVDISEESVWIEPLRNRRYNSGFGYGGYYDDGYGYDGYDGYYGEAAIELAFGFIIGIAVAALFLW